MELTEEQLQAAKAELDRRRAAEEKRYSDEYERKVREADERFWARMRAKYPHLDKDTMYDIYTEICSYYR